MTEKEKEIAIMNAMAFNEIIRSLTENGDTKIPWTDFGLKKYTTVLYERPHDKVR